MSIKVGILGLAHGHVMSYGRKWIEHPEWNIELVGGWDHDMTRRNDVPPLWESRHTIPRKRCWQMWML